MHCSNAHMDTLAFKLTCHTSFGSAILLIKEVLEFFDDLKILQVNNCKLDLSGYEVTSNATSSLTVDLIRERGDDSNFIFFYNLTVQLNYRLEDAKNQLPNCSLTRLLFRFTQLFNLPVGFISMCNDLESVSFEQNDFTFLDIVDFAVIFTRPHLKSFSLGHNYLKEIAPDFVRKAMKHTLWFLTGRLKSWMNHTYLTPNETIKFNNLSTIFEGWSNQSSPLLYQDLVSFIENTGLDIDFVLNNSPLAFLYLSHNYLQSVPLALIGFNRLTDLQIRKNQIKQDFMEYQLHVFYAFRNSLNSLDMQHNSIQTLPPQSFKYLTRVITFILNYNEIREMSRTAFGEDSEMKYLYISHNQLSHIDFAYRMNSLTKLEASNNSIYSLPEDLPQKIPKIESIDLSYNPIKYLAPFNLLNLRKLLKLNLTSTQMTDFQASVFKTSSRAAKGLRVATYMYDIPNRITCDCYSVFPILKKVEAENSNINYPYFFWNKLNETEGVKCKEKSPRYGNNLTLDRQFLCVFTGSKSITVIHPDSKDERILVTCPEKCMCSYTNPSTIEINIDCSKKKLDNVPQYTTNKERPPKDVMVNRFILKENNIKSIAINEFTEQLHSLDSLYLNYNQLEILGPRIFQHLTRLRFLDLSYNRISFIDSSAFASSPWISFLYLHSVLLTSLDKTPFTPLKRLSSLDLSFKQSFNCNCSSLLDFYDFRFLNTARITLSGNCSIGDKMMPISIAEETCVRQRREEKDAYQKLVWRCAIGVTGGTSLLLIFVLFFLFSRLRFRLMIFLDATVRSSVGRKLLRLSRHNLSHGIDIAFLVHECQTEQYREMLFRLQHSSRRDLVVIHFADKMPGSTHISSIRELVQNIAVCVVLISKEFLEDAVTCESLRSLLSQYIDRRQDDRRIIPVLYNRRVLKHELWPTIAVLIRQWPLLTWQQSSFWPRFLTALPAPKGKRYERNEDDRMYENLMTNASPINSQIWSLADVCIIAHQSQTDQSVRRLYDRYRRSMTLCYLCRDYLYGVTVSDTQVQCLEDVFAQCPQLVVLMSSELLASSWFEHQLVPALQDHLNAMPFRGSVIFIELTLSVGNLCRTQHFQFYNELRKQELVVTMTWQELEANWNLLNTWFLSVSFHPEMSTMDEVEFSTLLQLPSVRLNKRMSEESECLMVNA